MAFSGDWPARWFERALPSDERRMPGVNIGDCGTGGAWPAWASAYAVVVIFLFLIDTINVFTALSDAARQGRDLPTWYPIAWEATSGLATLATCWIVGAAVARARPGIASWRRLLLVHGGASIAFSLAHVGLMVALRVAIHAMAGETYHFGAGEWLYEYRKDVVAYVIIATIFWFFMRQPLEGRQLAGAQNLDAISIPQGTGFVRLRADQLITVKASGNYVEYALEGGRTLLVRASLQDTASSLSALGMVRTHRSWLVSRSKVTEMRPTGSGDFRLMLSDGRIIPLARRYRQKLDDLRGI